MVVDFMEPAFTACLEVLFWSSLALVFYNYAGYPVLVFLVSGFFPANDHQSVSRRQKDLPRVTVLIVACNAERHILARIENVLACDYPSDRIEILVASDRSTDATAALAEGLDDLRVRALAFSQRRGKTRTLVDAVQHVHSDVILFTDAQGS